MEMQHIHTPVPSVDPAEWLARFEAVGGGFVVRGEEASVTLALFRRSPEDQQAGCAMIGQIEADPLLKSAVIAHLSGSDATDSALPAAAKPEEDESWEQKVDRWRALAALCDADAEFGRWNRVQGQLAEQRRSIIEGPAAARATALRKIEAAHTDAFADFLAEFDEPATRAALALIETPAPDAAGIDLKLEAIRRHELDLNPTIGVDLAACIRADVVRLFGEM